MFTIDEEQNYDDQEWRNIQHSYNAELREIRETSAARMSTSAEEHTQIIMDIEESHKTELQLLQKRLEGQMKVSMGKEMDGRRRIEGRGEGQGARDT